MLNFLFYVIPKFSFLLVITKLLSLIYIRKSMHFIMTLEKKKSYVPTN